MCWPQMSLDGSPNLETLMEFQRWAFDRGNIDRVLGPDEFWHPAPLEAIEAGSLDEDR